LEIIAKLATALEVEPAELLRVPPQKTGAQRPALIIELAVLPEPLPRLRRA
jgi:hypothetical protein